MDDWIDIGDGHYIRYFIWAPDRKLNPQYDHLPDVDKFGIQIKHGICMSAINFDGPVQKEILKDSRHMWQVESWEPLTISPSVLCTRCGDHGFIKGGKWIKA